MDAFSRCIALDPRTELGRKFRSVAAKWLMEEMVLFVDDVRGGKPCEYIIGEYIDEGAPRPLNVSGEDRETCLGLYKKGERGNGALFGDMVRRCVTEICHSEAFRSFANSASAKKRMKAYRDAALVHEFFSQGRKLGLVVADRRLSSMIKYCESGPREDDETFVKYSVALARCCVIVEFLSQI
jgi:hypothetical protein